VLEHIPLEEVSSSGYSFQIEMNFKAWKRGYRIKEVSIIFHDRTEGSSKMSKKIIVEAIFMVWKLKIYSLFGRY
jgi:dolichol-phosphate mannosyltransferase